MRGYDDDALVERNINLTNGRQVEAHECVDRLHFRVILVSLVEGPHEPHVQCINIASVDDPRARQAFVVFTPEMVEVFVDDLHAERWQQVLYVLDRSHVLVHDPQNQRFDFEYDVGGIDNILIVDPSKPKGTLGDNKS